MENGTSQANRLQGGRAEKKKMFEFEEDPAGNEVVSKSQTIAPSSSNQSHSHTASNFLFGFGKSQT
jgi:hypothetical protein